MHCTQMHCKQIMMIASYTVDDCQIVHASAKHDVVLFGEGPMDKAILGIGFAAGDIYSDQ